MRLSRRIYMIIFMIILVAAVSITMYVKSSSVYAKNEIQNSTSLAINKDKLQLEKAYKLEEQQNLERKQQLKVQQKLEVQNKLKEKQKLEDQKKLEVQQKSEEVSKQQKTSSQNQTSSISRTQTKISPEPPKPAPQLIIDKIKGKGNAEQAIVVTTNGFGPVNAIITTYEKVNSIWKQVSSVDGNVGRTGFAYNKVEGDGHSPIGIFTLGTAFGVYSNPGTSLTYRRSTSNDFWVDDSNSSLYNTWQEGPVNGRWTSAENMCIPSYNYGFVINYNTTNRTPGKGSAIFFHVWSGSGHGTAGCISTSQNNVISILRWLKTSKNPVIIQGPLSEVLKM